MRTTLLLVALVRTVASNEAALCDPCFGLNTNSSGAAKRIRSATLPRLCQLHIQKTGTDFVETLVRFACPGFEFDARSFVAHDEWQTVDYARDERCWRSQIMRDLENQDQEKNLLAGHGHHSLGYPPSTPRAPRAPHAKCECEETVAMLRAPAARLLSAGFQQFYSPGLSINEPENRDMWLDGQLGCATRALVGHTPYCHWWPKSPQYVEAKAHGLSRANFTAAMLPLALERLGCLAFVGLTERWKDSVCLFHAMHGGTPDARQFGKGSNGPRAPRVHGELGLAALTKDIPHDPPDEALYDAAIARFERDMREYTRCNSQRENPV